MSVIRKTKWLGCFILTIGFGTVWPNTLFEVSHESLVKVEKEFGRFAKLRIENWLRLMANNGKLSESEKLRLVNRFFNQVEFIGDLENWGVVDYWATPLELLTVRGGDCEDFAIAKYFTLKALGVPEKRMHLTYVKSLQLNQAHMVLAYFSNPNKEPLVLDNLIDEIKPSSQRSDLIPVYSFNGDGLWIAKQRGAGKRVGSSGRIALWRDLLKRMGNQRKQR